MCVLRESEVACPKMHAATAGALQRGCEDPMVCAYMRHLWVGGVGCWRDELPSDGWVACV